jgi:transcriptional regulator with XRE-family HTH domain
VETLGTKLRRQRRRLGLTLDELAGRAGISKPYLSLIETGRVLNPPSDEKLRRLEQSLGFPSGELLTQAHLQRTPSDVRAMLETLMQGKDGKLPSAPAGADPEGAETRPSLAAAMIPVINRVLADYPTDFTDLSYPARVAEDQISCPDLHDKKAFAARVHGDSMMPKYADGDIVIFSPALSPRHGDDCFIRFPDGRTTFRRIFFEFGEGGAAVLRLQPRNERHRAQVVSTERVAGMYRAVYRYQKVDECE